MRSRFSLTGTATTRGGGELTARPPPSHLPAVSCGGWCAPSILLCASTTSAERALEPTAALAEQRLAREVDDRGVAQIELPTLNYVPAGRGQLRRRCSGLSTALAGEPRRIRSETVPMSTRDSSIAMRRASSSSSSTEPSKQLSELDMVTKDGIGSSE